MILIKKRRKKGTLQREQNGKYTARITIAGRSYSRGTGTEDRAKALQALEEFVSEIDLQQRSARKDPPLMKDWVQYTRTANAALFSETSHKIRSRVWRVFAAWAQAEHPEVKDVRDVTRKIADDYLHAIQQNRTGSTCNMYICHLRSVFRALLDEYGVELNPWDRIKIRVYDRRSRREFTVDEVKRLMSAAAKKGEEWLNLFATAAYTGMRLGDCCTLCWEQVDVVHGIIQMVPHKTRRYSNGCPVTIPIHSQLLSLLMRTPEGKRTGFVLPIVAEAYGSCRWYITNGINSIFEAAKITRSIRIDGRCRRTPVATFHSLRHSFVSFAVNAGVPIAAVQAIVGHASSAMTRHYYHANETILRQVVDAIPSFEKGSRGTSKMLAVRNCLGIPKPKTISRRLKDIDKLLDRGIICEEEYKTMRARILADA